MNQNREERMKEDTDRDMEQRSSAKIVPTKALMKRRAPKITALRKQFKVSKRVSKWEISRGLSSFESSSIWFSIAKEPLWINILKTKINERNKGQGPQVKALGRYPQCPKRFKEISSFNKTEVGKGKGSKKFSLFLLTTRERNTKNKTKPMNK